MAFHRKLNRLNGYNYSDAGYYFITICTKNKIECFGKIENGKMILNKYGEIVDEQLLWLTKQYGYVLLDQWVIMPNHIHAIVIIDSTVGTGLDLSLQKQNKQKNKQNLSLSNIIGAFKTTSSKLIHQNGLLDFLWQRSFYDHIVRDEKTLNKIREYIVYNPLKWDLDRNNAENLWM